MPDADLKTNLSHGTVTSTRKIDFLQNQSLFYEDGTITIVYEELFTRKFGLQSNGSIMSDSTHITFPKF